MLLPLLLLAAALGTAHAGEKVSLLGQETLLESYGPLSTHPRTDTDKTMVFVGGVPAKKVAEEYRKKIDAGAKPAEIEGPERLYSFRLEGTPPFRIERLKPALALKGFHLNDPAVFRLPGSNDLAMVFTQGENGVAESCRKQGESTRGCAAYSLARELGWATSSDEGLTWSYKGVLVKAKDSGDLSGAASPAVVLAKSEIWLYYATGRQNFAQENLFRLRFDPTLSRKLAPPEPVKLGNFVIGLSIESPHLVRLNCENNTKFVVTLAGNLRAQNALPFYLSTDGLQFRLAAESFVSEEGSLLSNPTQLPGPASLRECEASDLSGVPTLRDLLYVERKDAEHWLLRRAQVRIVLPRTKQ